ncbi:WYL domain-containing protein [Roseovarius sp. CAU 1744]|uniref:WYL domain-containing protein n=1 Tax=Roseovarius sp. CAU 1744 TaxID=3140368 RepID=UPI00325B9019
MDVMGLSRAQASKDLNSYINDHPEHIIYDKTAKTYVLGPKFVEHYAALDPSEYLDDLLSISQGGSVPAADWIVYQPDILATTVPGRGLSAFTLRNVLLACEQRKALRISYQSMSSPDPEDRVIIPHALAHDGFRWHARALCSKDQIFKDFVLGRILKSALGEQSDVDAGTDEDWHQTITLKIAPHPDFSKIQARFSNRMPLNSADIAEVIQRRLLAKTSEGQVTLGNLHDREENNLKTLFDFADGSMKLKNYRDRDHFISSYPFPPYQYGGAARPMRTSLY